MDDNNLFGAGRGQKRYKFVLQHLRVRQLTLNGYVLLRKKKKEKKNIWLCPHQLEVSRYSDLLLGDCLLLFNAPHQHGEAGWCPENKVNLS